MIIPALSLLSLFQEDLLAQAASGGIIIGNLVTQPKPALVAITAAFPGRDLEVRGAENLLCPFPFMESYVMTSKNPEFPTLPKSVEKLINKRLPFLLNQKENALKPVVVCLTR